MTMSVIVFLGMRAARVVTVTFHLGIISVRCAYLLLAG